MIRLCALYPVVTTIDARMRIGHPCPYCDISVAFPRSLLLLWCDNQRDVFLVSSPDLDELQEVLSALRSGFHARLLLRDGNDALVTVPDFTWSEPVSVTSLARRTGIWVLHPVVYFDGKETYRLVAPSSNALNRLISPLRRLGDVELLSVRRREGLGSVRETATAGVHFFEGITEKQARSLVAAYEGGILEVPSRSTWGSVARRHGLSRSTFGEHIRKGQRQLVSNSVMMLKYLGGPRVGPLLLPKIGPPAPKGKTPLLGTR